MLQKAMLVLFSFFAVPAVALAGSFWDLETNSPEVNGYQLPRYPEDNVIGKLQYYDVQSGESFASIAQRFGVGFDELKSANPKVKSLRAGTQLVIPTFYILPDTREGIVINQAENRLYYFDLDSKKVWTFPVAIGRQGRWRTPLMETTVINKYKDPTWYVPKSIKENSEKKGIILPDRVLPGPDNPLGEYALRLGTYSHLIHGTNTPWQIGKRVSSGCIRMYPRHIELLYGMVEKGTKVVIINQPFKVGQRGKKVYLEVHSPPSDFKKIPFTILDQPLRQIIEQGVGVDVIRVAEIEKRRKKSGVPERIDSDFTRQQYERNN